MNVEEFRVISASFGDGEPIPYTKEDIQSGHTILDLYSRLLRRIAADPDVAEIVEGTIRMSTNARNGRRLVSHLNVQRYADDRLGQWSAKERRSFVIKVLGAFFAEFSPTTNGPSNIGEELVSEKLSYMNYVDMRGFIVAELKDEGEMRASERREASEYKSQLEAEGKDIRETVNRATERFQVLNKSIAASENRYNEIATEYADIDAKITALREALNLGASRDLWERRAARHDNMFNITSIGMMIVLAVLPAIALANYDTVLGALKEINTYFPVPETATPGQITIISLSRSVILAVPLILYLWMIKIIVRLNLHSLIMADDARQRGTIMDTFIHLVEKEVVTKDDRTLMMEAIFRPAPGQTSDGVDPPGFIGDILSKIK